MSTDIQSVGRVYVFRSLTLLQILEGKQEFEQFGFSVKIAVWNGENVAIVSSVSGGKIGLVMQGLRLRGTAEGFLPKI